MEPLVPYLSRRSLLLPHRVAHSAPVPVLSDRPPSQKDDAGVVAAILCRAVGAKGPARIRFATPREGGVDATYARLETSIARKKRGRGRVAAFQEGGRSGSRRRRGRSDRLHRRIVRSASDSVERAVPHECKRGKGGGGAERVNLLPELVHAVRVRDSFFFSQSLFFFLVW